MLRSWNIVVITFTLCNVLCALNCTEQFICYIQPETGKSFAEQVIEAGTKHFNASFTILAFGGDYNATNGKQMNFVNFRNVTIMNHPNNTLPVNIMCPGITLDNTHNGIGFAFSRDIEISGLNFSRCGIVTSGLYFRSVTDLFVHHSTFHHNTDNGIQILFGNNIHISNCNFYSNVGLQPDSLSNLITDDDIRVRGVGLGLFFEDQKNVSVTIEGCKFTNNIAYKAADYGSAVETRPYGFIPFGNGGAIYLKLNRVRKSYTNIADCGFYNNTAIHQGGAVMMISVNATDNMLNISKCEFVGNRVPGVLLRGLPLTINGSNPAAIDNFINTINYLFSLPNINIDVLSRLNFSTLRRASGSGGAIVMSLFGSVERNILHISNSNFTENAASHAGAIGFVVWDLLSNVESGIDSNQAFIISCNFDHNVAPSASAIGIASLTRVDVASLPTKIYNCTFKNNEDLGNLLPFGIVSLLGITGTVVGIRFPLSFEGTNVFQSNLGGGINVNHARVSFHGLLKFYDNHEAKFGGAIRLGEITLMHVLPSTTLEFVNNSAFDFGGAFAVDNFRGESDTTLVLNNFCFIQYNIGHIHEYNPNKWNVTFIFNNNTLTNQNGQGQAFYADDISQCIIGHTAENKEPTFASSIFSNTPMFTFSYTNDSSEASFETAPHTLILNETIEVSVGEIFDLSVKVEDENGNSKDAVFSYYTPKRNTRNPSNVIAIDLQSDEDTIPSFASVNKVTMQDSSFTIQKASLVLHNSEELTSKCVVNYQNSQTFMYTLILSLIDSTNGQVVNVATVNVRVKCCHAAYEYSSVNGECLFNYNYGGNSNITSVILREDKTNKYMYIRSDRYGGFDSDKNFVTATIPPSYQKCTPEKNLPGCKVMDDYPDAQCSQNRTGFLCGRCKSSETSQGTALNLIECVSCEAWHIGMFVVICFLIVVISFTIIYCNIGLPNALKGFLFFIQVVGYVYRTGVKDGVLKWDFYLSRFFGFSLYFPLCISPKLDAVNVALLGFVTPLLMAMCTVTYIILARFVPHLSARKTVDGIWFLVLIAYVYTADTCLSLLRCVQVYEPIEFNGKRVYYFDGELECYKGKHLPYGVIASIVSIFVLLTLPLYVLAISFNLIKKGGPLRDVISSGIAKQYHWWSGYDLVRRLLFFIVYLFFENIKNNYTQLSLTVTALLILVVTSRAQPYHKRWENFAEALILMDLIFISAYFLNNDRLSSTVNNHFAIGLLVLPYLYFLTYLLIKLLWKRFAGVSQKGYIFHNSVKLVSNSLKDRWSSIFLSNEEEVSTAFVSTAVGEDAMYEEYRDELDDYVTIAN